MYARGKDASSTQRHEFIYSKKLFDKGKISEDQRAYYSFGSLSATQKAQYEDEAFKMTHKSGGKKRKKDKSIEQEIHMQSARLAVKVCKQHLISLENYGVKSADGVVAIVWRSDMTDAEKERSLSSMVTADVAEMANMVLGEAEVDDDEESNLDY